MARGVGDDGLAYGLALTRVRSVNRLAQQQWRQAGRIRPDLEDDIDEAAADAAFDAVFDRGAQDSFAPFLGGGTGRNRDDLYVPR